MDEDFVVNRAAVQLQRAHLNDLTYSSPNDTYLPSGFAKSNALPSPPVRGRNPRRHPSAYRERCPSADLVYWASHGDLDVGRFYRFAADRSATSAPPSKDITSRQKRLVGAYMRYHVWQCRVA
jgi:hypothetical protein